MESSGVLDWNGTIAIIDSVSEAVPCKYIT